MKLITCVASKNLIVKGAYFSHIKIHKLGTLIEKKRKKSDLLHFAGLGDNFQIPPRCDLSEDTEWY
jgi:hypothetical protein